MMVSFDQLRNADTSVFRAACIGYGQFALAAARGADDLVRAEAALASWQGDAGAAANAELARLRGTFEATQAPLRRLDTLLAAHADAIEQAQRKLARVVVSHSGHGAVQISMIDGSVRPVIDEHTHPEVVHQRHLIAVRVAGEIQEALREAEAADAETARRLAEITPALLSGYGVEPYPSNGIPARGTDPSTVRQWWDSLSPQQREYLIREHPDRIGWLDGLPADDRDRANRIVLDQQRDLLGDRRAVLAAKGAGRTEAETQELADIEEKLAGIASIQERLDRTLDDATGVGAPRAYLLGFDTLGKGHAVVAIGNPDMADNVVTYVPGTGARLGQVGGDLSRADAMASDANILDPSRRTSAIMWIGYDAPQSIVPDAMRPSYAREAADDLDCFQDGLRISHEGDRAHQVVLGHSYGSTVVGHTARDYGIDADDIIVVGSPGMGVDSVTQLRGADGAPLAPDHVWSSHARHDPIQYASYTDLVPIGDDGLQPADVLVHGRNPSEPEFGAHTFTSDPGEPVATMRAHSQYWDPYSSSRRNIALIIIGQRGEVS